MGKTIEEKYQKFTQREHVLARPGMYIGEVKTITTDQWVIDDSKMVFKNLSWNPGVFKVFDEILTNAADESQRNTTVKSIKVDVSPDQISILNDGSGIPVEIHKEHNIYVAELIFGSLLSSSNYDDTEKRTTGGTNGLGAKLTNIYSTEFIIETVCSGKKYIQVFKNNLTDISKPKITASKGKEYTKITFKPDFVKFGIESLDSGTLSVLQKRTYDICAVTNKGVSVFFNGNKLTVKDFQDYISLYIGTKTESPRVYEESRRWKVGVSLGKESFQCVSFVNGISTTDGGSHVDHVIFPIIKKITEELQAKHKNITIKPQYVKDSLFLFIDCIIENPTFSSQTKDKNTTRVTEFGSRFVPSDDFIKKIMKLGFVDSLLAIAEAKDKKSLKKTDGKKTTRVCVPKLDDANKAGTSMSEKCTLILTEGDSAKTTAISGLSVVGRDFYGVFPLRGKLLNTRTATFSQVSANKEINDIKQILGLQSGKDYKNITDLRYGKILIMTDQDTDGFHIKSLLVNFIGYSWPNLLSRDFIYSLLTPIVKVSRQQTIIPFYNMIDYEEWRKTTREKWHVKYYKGLGTSTAKEAKEYFKNMKSFKYKSTSDQDLCALDLAFKKTLSDDRKKWILSATKTPGTIDYTKTNLCISDLVNKELVLFSIQDNIRSLPSLVDGLKPSQRKVLFSCFKRNLIKEIKVAQLAGYISEHTSYHHGEQSLMDTIINMAQDYVGANNMPLLVPSGQFGTRIMGGKDSSSPRYIYTYLSENSKIFNKDDFDLLDYLNDDGFPIEPKYYVPILPLILINGSVGIGTGFSTNIPCFNPDDIKKRLLLLVDDIDADIEELTPWYKGFTGTIRRVDDNKWVSHGVYNIKDYTITITELPVGSWTDDYKEFLEKLEQDSTIHSFRNESTEDKVKFEVKVKKDILSEWKKTFSVEKHLKLTSNINAKNMNVFNEKGQIVKMSCAEEILFHFFTVRNDFYEKRKTHLINKLSGELEIISSKVRFIKSIINDELIVFRKKRSQIIVQLEKMEFPKKKDYDYLLDMRIQSFTEEKITELEKECSEKQKNYDYIKNVTISELWKKDLN
jgi:DNA topoisomerase II